MLYHHKQNSLSTRFDDICEIFMRYDCTFSLVLPCVRAVSTTPLTPPSWLS